MTGGKPWTQRGTKGGGQHVATVDRPKIEHLNLDQSTSIASGGTEKIEVYAPAGATYDSAGLALRAPDEGTDGTTGTHRFLVYPQAHVNTLVGASVYSSVVRFDYGTWHTADDLQRPSSAAAQQAQMRALTATENNPIYIRYENDMDVAQDQTRKIRLLLKERSY